MQNFNVKKIVLCALFAALIAIGAFIRIPVPVVPFTLQFLFTNLAGIMLGKKLGALSVVVYIALGLVGLPVFTSGGGPAYVLQPTFGYIIGFALGAYAAGAVLEKFPQRQFKHYVLASIADIIIVYACGMVYYYFISNYYMGETIGVSALFLYCFVMAVPGDILLCFLSSYIAKKTYKVTRGVLYENK